MEGFEWDEAKDASNYSKHGVSLAEAATVFTDPFAIVDDDVYHSAEENRYLIVGYSSEGRLLLVCYTEREDNIRLISARNTTAHEKKNYEQAR